MVLANSETGWSARAGKTAAGVQLKEASMNTDAGVERGH